MTEQLPTCCAFHGFEEGGCNGHKCPAGRCDLRAILTRRILPTDPRRGVEAALPRAFTDTPIVTDDIKPVREPIDWQAVVIWIAVSLCLTAVLALSIADPRDLSSIWPRLVAFASF